MTGKLTTAGDLALEDALARVRELSLRLWDIRAAHRPVRGLLGRVRCRTCNRPYPCPTLQAAGPPAVPRFARATSATDRVDPEAPAGDLAGSAALGFPRPAAVRRPGHRAAVRLIRLQ